MKTVPPELATHISQEVTTLCTCWRITRVDGSQLFFTDADEDVVQDGKTYTAIGAYKRTAIENTSTLSVDNLEVVGMANQLVLPDNELQSGLFDNAEVNIFITSWQGGVTGELKMRRGFFGEIQVMPNGTYQVELRGLMQRLSYTYTDVFTPSCRLDLGEKACGIPIPKGQLLRSTYYDVGETVVAPAAANVDFVGTYAKMPISDPSFEDVGTNGFDTSLAWRSTGAVLPTFPNIDPIEGENVVRGGNGTTEITQDIDLIDSTILTADVIDKNQSQATLYGWRRDTSGTGRIRMSFLDGDMETLDYGRSIRSNATKMTPSAPIVLAGDFTAEVWVYRVAGATNNRVGMGGFGTTTNSSTAGNHADIRFDPPRIFHNPEIPDPSVSYGTSSQSLTDGQWYHVAVTRRVSDGQVTTYIDGIQKGQSSGYVDTMTFDFVLSTIDGTTDAYYDEFRVWNIVREGYQIRDDMKRTIPSTTTGLIHYWRFNDSDGSASTGGVTINTGSNTFEDTLVSPVAVNSSHSPNTASSGTGLEDVGTSWVLRSINNRAIPIGTRYLRIRFDSTSSGNYLDSMFGWVVDTNGTEMPSTLADNSHYTCTIAGTTGSGVPALGGGSITDGTATFVRQTNSYARGGLVTSSDGPRVFRAEVTDTRAVDAWFNGGVVTFETGSNKGVSMEVKSWTQDSGQLELFLSLPFNIEPGDIFRVYPGCDKSRVSCAAIFANIINFRGFPDIPGQDDLYRYPDARQ